MNISINSGSNQNQCGLIITLSLIMAGVCFSQSSTNYSLKKSVINQGGGSSVSNHYQVTESIGQPGVTDIAVSTHYQVSSGFLAGGITVSNVVEMDEAEIPEAFRLYQNFPNPFNPRTTLQFDVKEPCEVTLTLYNQLGQQVRLLAKSLYDPGSYKISLAANDIPSGIYIYRIRMGNFTDTKKLVLLE